MVINLSTKELFEAYRYISATGSALAAREAYVDRLGSRVRTSSLNVLNEEQTLVGQ